MQNETRNKNIKYQNSDNRIIVYDKVSIYRMK